MLLIAVMAVIDVLTPPEALFDRVREELARRNEAEGRWRARPGGLEGTDWHTLVTDGGEPLEFCPAGCLETDDQQTAS
jgi:hypothetical protein